MNIYGSLIVLHLIAACVWVGSQVVLACSILPQAAQERDAFSLFRIKSVYTTVAFPALILGVFTGFVLAYLHVPDPRLWFDFENPMGRVIGLKLILLVLLLVLGLDLRLRLFPKVSRIGIDSLKWHFALIVVVSLLLVCVGASFRIGWFY